MNAALAARLIAAGRLGFGIALIVSPGRMTERWLGDDAGRAGTQVAVRGLGARDVALGVGALAAHGSQLQPWVAAAIVADTADLVSTLAAGDSLPLEGRVLAGAMALGGAVAGVMALAALRSRSLSS